MSIYWKKLEQYYLLDYNTPPHCVYVRVLFFLFFFSKSTEYSLHLQNKHTKCLLWATLTPCCTTVSGKRRRSSSSISALSSVLKHCSVAFSNISHCTRPGRVSNNPFKRKKKIQCNSLRLNCKGGWWRIKDKVNGTLLHTLKTFPYISFRILIPEPGKTKMLPLWMKPIGNLCFFRCTY